jgi:hypothetical protein
VCTLTCAWRALPDAPVALAATRDEATDRPSSPPRVREIGNTDPDALDAPDLDGDGAAAADAPSTAGGPPRVLAPRDERAGGTWLGVNEHGVVAAIANRPTPPPETAEHSRGSLVAAALACDSAEDGARAVERALDHGRYAGFTLLVADAAAALLVSWDGSRVVRTLDPGVHVVTNADASGDTTVGPAEGGIGDPHGGVDDTSDPDDALATAVLTRLRVEPGERADPWLDRAGVALGDHDLGACLHGDGFGTRSASLVAVGDRIDYRYAAGPPCEAAFEAVTHDLALTPANAG